MLGRLAPPWDSSRPSILEHVHAHLPPDGQSGLLDGGEDLPDEQVAEGEIRWAPGALDGVFAHHVDPGEAEAQLSELVAAVAAAGSGRRKAGGRNRLYELAKAVDPISVADPLLERVRALGMPLQLIQPTARWLVTEGRHRGPVKLGIVLLGLGHTAQDRTILKTLGRHEEFTVFVSVALANTVENADEELFELAKAVNGWGRIHVVERLAATDDPLIREWIFRHGFRNSIMYEYLAHTAATTGDLVGHLRDDPDEEALDAACDIITALIDGGPAQDIGDYEQAAEAVDLLLRLLVSRATKLSHFLVVDDIAGFLARDDGWDERTARGWTAAARRSAAELAQQVKAQPRWNDLATRGLAADDELVFYEAERVARALGQDTFAAHLRRLVADPLASNWWAVMQMADEQRIAEIVSLAERTLPLTEIATGPGTALGLGPRWKEHGALDFIVQDIGRFPGHGWSLVKAALRSPVIRNRNMAVNALSAWGLEHWPADASAAVERALAEEPDGTVRSRLARLLRGEPLDD